MDSQTPPDVALQPHPDRNYLSPQDVTEAQALEFFELIESSMSVTEASEKLGFSRRTGYRLVQKYEAKLDLASKLLSTKALAAVEDWATASKKAADKGDHRAAKDLLLHTKAIEPVEDSSRQGMNIAIVIGTPEQPIRMNPPQVVDATIVTPTE